jgi:hypothetical protein
MNDNDQSIASLDTDLNLARMPKIKEIKDLVEVVRRKSCQCTACYGTVKRKARAGENIVLDDEKEMIRRFRKTVSSGVEANQLDPRSRMTTRIVNLDLGASKSK